MVLSIISLTLSFAALLYCVKLTVVYHRFNEQIRDWAQSLDDTMNAAINRAARVIIKDLDDKLQQEKTKTENYTIEEDEQIE